MALVARSRNSGSSGGTEMVGWNYEDNSGGVGMTKIVAVARG